MGGRTINLQSISSVGERTINAQSLCNQYHRQASLPSICNKYAINMPQAMLVFVYILSFILLRAPRTFAILLHARDGPSFLLQVFSRPHLSAGSRWQVPPRRSGGCELACRRYCLQIDCILIVSTETAWQVPPRRSGELVQMSHGNLMLCTAGSRVPSAERGQMDVWHWHWPSWCDHPGVIVGRLYSPRFCTTHWNSHVLTWKSAICFDGK